MPGKTKIGRLYRIHTDVIKANLIPSELTAKQARFIRGAEADVLNILKRQDKSERKRIGFPARHTLPYAHLNLRRNPFGEMGRKERSAVVAADVGDLVKRLRKPGFAVQFMGRPGCGKTSHMLAILKYYPDGVFVHVQERERAFIPEGHPLFIDDVQLIPRRQRAGVFRRKASFILGTHEDMSVEFRKAGVETRTVYPEEAMRKESLHMIFHRRIENARRGPGRLPSIPMSEIPILMDRFGGDVRAMEHFLYDIFQTLKEVQDVSL